MSAGLAAALAILCLAALHRRDRRRVRQRRAAFFADCLALFERYRVTQDGLAYPVLAGRFRGAEVRLEPFVDSMAWRKLPSLWLKVTVLQENAYRGTLDYLVRPRGAEFYSPGLDLEHHLPVPSGWPQDAILCTDHASAMPPLDRLGPAIRLFAEPRMKELVITRRGVRLVRQIGQAKRAEYLVLRQAEFAEARLDAAVLIALLEAAVAVARDLAGAPLSAAA